MIYLPAAAGRTTRLLRRAGIGAAVATGAIVIVTTALELAALAGHGPGGHTSLYAGAVLGGGAAASLLSFAHARVLIAQATTAVVAEQAAQRETERQMVAELARLRAAVYGRSADERRLVIAVAAEGYRRGRADAGPDAETLREIYWNAYTDVLGDLGGGSAPAER